MFIIYFYYKAPIGVPFNFTVTAITSTSLILHWQPPPSEQLNGELTSFTIHVEEINTGMAYINTTSSPSIALDFLHPYYIYNISVRAVTVSHGPYSQAITIQTDQDGEIYYNCIYFPYIII